MLSIFLSMIWIFFFHFLENPSLPSTGMSSQYSHGTDGRYSQMSGPLSSMGSGGMYIIPLAYVSSDLLSNTDIMSISDIIYVNVCTTRSP